jgi:DNA-directed RNA polymerase subunit RPC12/RpoP
MGLKCSLLGHQYGDTEVRTDREQDGTEIVETTREVRLCERCGRRLVVSETTEVKTVETPREPDSGNRQPDVATDGAETGPTGGTPRSAGTTGPPEGGEVGGERTDDPGVDAEAGPRDARERLVGSEEAEPDIGGSGDTTTDAPPARQDDAIFIDEDGEEKPAAERPTGESAERPDWEPEIESEPDESPEQPSEPGAGLTVPEGEFHCTECGFSTTVESSSLREGDFCPECHRGALEHQSA